MAGGPGVHFATALVAASADGRTAASESRVASLRGQVERDRVKAALNEGGNSLRVKTSGGNIRVRGR